MAVTLSTYDGLALASEVRGDYSKERVKLAQTKYAHKFSSCVQQVMSPPLSLTPFLQSSYNNDLQMQNIGVGTLNALWTYSDDIVVVHVSCANDKMVLLSQDQNTTDWHPTSPVLTLMLDPKALSSHEAVRKLLPKLVQSVSKVSRAIEAAEREEDDDMDN